MTATEVGTWVWTIACALLVVIALRMRAHVARSGARIAARRRNGVTRLMVEGDLEVETVQLIISAAYGLVGVVSLLHLDLGLTVLVVLVGGRVLELWRSRRAYMRRLQEEQLAEAQRRVRDAKQRVEEQPKGEI